MAKKKRKRRSDEERITDLQDEIRLLKARAAAKALQSSPAIKSAIKTLKALDRALDLAAEEENSRLRHALADARKPLIECLEKEGLKIPKANLPRGRRPKDE